MRPALIALGACALLAGCGGPETSQANNGQANVSNTARPPATANNMVMLAIRPLPKAQALQLTHARHEGMETIGKNNKALHRELASSSPFMPTVRSTAGTIANLSVKASGWFPLGTGPTSRRPAPSRKSGRTRQISSRSSTISRRPRRR